MVIENFTKGKFQILTKCEILANIFLFKIFFVTKKNKIKIRLVFLKI